jgi:hypothetical protein
MHDMHVTALPALPGPCQHSKGDCHVPAWPWDDIMPVRVVFAGRVADPGGGHCLVL